MSTDAAPRPSIVEQIKCVLCELAVRRYVYPRLAEQGRMKKADAEHEIRTMEAVLDTLREVEAGEAGEP